MWGRVKGLLMSECLITKTGDPGSRMVNSLTLMSYKEEGRLNPREAVGKKEPVCGKEGIWPVLA